MRRTTDPRHVAVTEAIRARIVAGEWEPGRQIPTEPELAEEFQCSRGTIRRAMATLVQEGHVAARRGAGTFVQERKRARVIGLIIQNTTHVYFARLAETVLATARARDVAVLPYIGLDAAKELAFIERLRELGATGVIRTVTDDAREEQLRGALREARIPYVIVGDSLRLSEHEHHVAEDECSAARNAVDLLAGLGHERMAFHTTEHEVHPRAAEGFLAGLRARGLPAEPSRVSHLWHDHEHDIIRFEEGAPDATAIVTPHYFSGLYVLRALQHLRRSVPEDASVVTLGNLPPPQQRTVDFTSWEPPVERIAVAALDLALGDAPADAVHYLFQSSLHKGRTVAPPSSVCAGVAQTVRE